MNELEQPIFTALADPLRRKLLVNLAQNSPKTATQLKEDYPITRQGILKHLNVLEEAGLVIVQQQGREKRYSLRPEPLNEVDAWVKALSDIWDSRLLHLKAFLENEDMGG